MKPITASVVYFVSDGDDRVKIGTTTSLRRRLSALRTASATPLTLLATTPGDRSGEAILHKRLAKDRLTGEWFEFSDTVLHMITNLIPPVHGEFIGGRSIYKPWLGVSGFDLWDLCDRRHFDARVTALARHATAARAKTLEEFMAGAPTFGAAVLRRDKEESRSA